MKPLAFRMDLQGRNEAARRRHSLALEKQRTFSTVENHISNLKHSKDNESSKCGESEGIKEEHVGDMMITEGQQERNKDIKSTESNSQTNCSPEDENDHLNTPSSDN